MLVVTQYANPQQIDQLLSNLKYLLKSMTDVYSKRHKMVLKNITNTIAKKNNTTQNHKMLTVRFALNILYILLIYQVSRILKICHISTRKACKLELLYFPKSYRRNVRSGKDSFNHRVLQFQEDFREAYSSLDRFRRMRCRRKRCDYLQDG